MRIEKPQNISENEQGSALVYTLMVLLLLSLLGMSVGMVTVGSYRLASETQDSTSAYYIAKLVLKLFIETSRVKFLRFMSPVLQKTLMYPQ